jgi:hypothetical protein
MPYPNASLTGTEKVWLFDTQESTTIDAIGTYLGVGGSVTFISLTDVGEADYVGHGGDFVRVNSTPDGLEFVDLAASTGAALIGYDNTVSGAAATDVQAAIDEAFNASGSISSITDNFVPMGDGAGGLEDTVIEQVSTNEIEFNFAQANSKVRIMGQNSFDSGGAGIEFERNNTGAYTQGIYVISGSDDLAIRTRDDVHFYADTEQTVSIFSGLVAPNLRLHNYGSGTFLDASPAYLLGVQAADGDVIEVALAAFTNPDNNTTTNFMPYWDGDSWETSPLSRPTALIVELEDDAIIRAKGDPSTDDLIEFGGNAGQDGLLIIHDNVGGAAKGLQLGSAALTVMNDYAIRGYDERQNKGSSPTLGTQTFELNPSDGEWWTTGTVHIGGNTAPTREFFRVSDQVDNSTVASFGSDYPIALMKANPSVGFNAYWDSAQGWSIYNSSGTSWGGVLSFSHTTGRFELMRSSSGVATSGADLGEETIFEIAPSGQLIFNKYVMNAFTGTAARYLAVDASGNVIMEPVPSGAVSSVFGLTGDVDIVTLTEDVSPASNDWVVVENNAGGTFRKVQITNLGIGGGGDTFLDNVFRIQDNTDNTKEIAFEASGITTGTTRTITVLDSNGTMLLSGGLDIANGEIVYADTAVANLVTGTADFTFLPGTGLVLDVAGTAITVQDGSANDVVVVSALNHRISVFDTGGTEDVRLDANADSYITNQLAVGRTVADYNLDVGQQARVVNNEIADYNILIDAVQGRIWEIAPTPTLRLQSNATATVNDAWDTFVNSANGMTIKPETTNGVDRALRVQNKAATNKFIVDLATGFTQIADELRLDTVAEDTTLDRVLMHDSAGNGEVAYRTLTDIRGYAGAPVAVSASVTISSANQDTYAGRLLYVDSTSAAVTITLDDSVTVGFWCDVLWDAGSNAVDFAADAGATIRSKDSELDIDAIGAGASVYKYSSTNFWVVGDLKA